MSIAMIRAIRAAQGGRLAGSMAARQVVCPASRRWNSSQDPKAAPGQSKLVWVAGLLAVGGGGLYFTNEGSSSSSSSSSSNAKPPISNIPSAPSFLETASEQDIPVASPIKVLTLDESNAKIREQARTFVFESKDGKQGRVDLVRLASNNPVEDEWTIGVGKGVGGDKGAKTLYTGVYDGHAGWATSKVLTEALIPYVSSALSQLSSSSPGDVVDSAIKKAFVRLDERIMSNAIKATEAGYDAGSAEVISALAPAIAGSCALLTIYDPKSSILRTAITGDCRAVLGSWSADKRAFTADQLSEDQTGFNKDEVERLDKAHPGEKEDILDAKSGRLMGLAVTRAFGDHRWKWTTDFIKSVSDNFYGPGARPKNKTPPYLTASPEVTTRTVQGRDFVILASDGLWDVISPKDAVTCVSRWLDARRAGKPEEVVSVKGSFVLDTNGESTWTVKPDGFAIEDLDSAAVCLLKNAMGGRQRSMFCGRMTAYSPLSRYVRDDVTIQVVFFEDPYKI